MPNLPPISIVNDHGVPINGAKVTVYEAGPNGKHLATLTADENGAVPTVYVDAESLKITAFDRDDRIVWRFDDFEASGSS